jgi:predicted adenylyl cyclase CyaB
MINIELKARLHDRAKAVAACGELGAECRGEIHQVDTYFPVARGRFKFRASDPGDDYLVYYRRPDVSGPKTCDYVIRIVPRDLLPVLEEALGTLAVVEKRRTLYLWQNVRIHLDEVTGLGSFIEFEAVLSDKDDPEENARKVDRLQALFGIGSIDLIEGSYLEMQCADHSE